MIQLCDIAPSYWSCVAMPLIPECKRRNISAINGKSPAGKFCHIAFSFTLCQRVSSLARDIADYCALCGICRRAQTGGREGNSRHAAATSFRCHCDMSGIPFSATNSTFVDRFRTFLQLDRLQGCIARGTAI